MIFWLNNIVRWIRMTFQAVRNVRNQWAPELKQLSDNIEKLEESLAGTDDCVLDIYSLEETHGNRMDVMEEELTSVKTCITDLKEELNAVKAENVEIRNHFNSMLKELNAIAEFINEKHGHKIIEHTYEIDPPPNKGYNLRGY